MLVPLNICQVITCKPELIRKIKAFADVIQLRTFKQDYLNLREGHYYPEISVLSSYEGGREIK